MKPTVGRIVYYKSYGTPNGEYKPEERAAIVTGVVDDGTVHLCVLNPTGMFFNLNVKQGNQGGQWDWMPYQKGQAKRTEEALNALRDLKQETVVLTVPQDEEGLINKIQSSLFKNAAFVRRL